MFLYNFDSTFFIGANFLAYLNLPERATPDPLLQLILLVDVLDSLDGHETKFRLEEINLSLAAFGIIECLVSGAFFIVDTYTILRKE